jgi:hypothetical protein
MAFGGQVDTGMTALELSRLLQIDLIELQIELSRVNRFFSLAG